MTGGIINISFKEVVEKFAANNGIEFFPRPPSSVSTIIADQTKGKPLFQFGKSLCFIDQDVVFVASASVPPGKTTQWNPIDLEALLLLAQ